MASHAASLSGKVSSPPGSSVVYSATSSRKGSSALAGRARALSMPAQLQESSDSAGRSRSVSTPAQFQGNSALAVRSRAGSLAEQPHKGGCLSLLHAFSRCCLGNTINCCGSTQAAYSSFELDLLADLQAQQNSETLVDFEITPTMSPRSYFLALSQIYDTRQVYEARKAYLDPEQSEPQSSDDEGEIRAVKEPEVYTIHNSASKKPELQTDLMEVLRIMTRTKFQGSEELRVEAKKYFRSVNFFSTEVFTQQQSLYAGHFKEALKMAFATYKEARATFMMHQMQIEVEQGAVLRQISIGNTGDSVAAKTAEVAQYCLGIPKADGSIETMQHSATASKEGSDGSNAESLEEDPGSKTDSFHTAKGSSRGSPVELERLKPPSRGSPISGHASSGNEALSSADLEPEKKYVIVAEGKYCPFNREKVKEDLKLLIAFTDEEYDKAVEAIHNNIPVKATLQQVWDALKALVNTYPDKAKRPSPANEKRLERYIQTKLVEKSEAVTTIRDVDDSEMAAMISTQIRKVKTADEGQQGVAVQKVRKGFFRKKTKATDKSALV